MKAELLRRNVQFNLLVEEFMDMIIRDELYDKIIISKLKRPTKRIPPINR